MKKNEIQIGGTYLAKVSDKVVPVRVDAENSNGGWDATNLMTGKTIRIKSAQRFRSPANRNGSAQAGLESPVPAEATAATTESKPTGRAKKNRIGLGMNNTWTDEPESPETTSSVEAPVASAEAPAVETPASEAAPPEPVEAPAVAAEAVALPDPAEPTTADARPVPTPTLEANAPGQKLSAIDAAARVLAEEGRPMNCREMIGAMAAKGYWHSPGGKTPAATLYSSILRELKVKGEQARFAKADRGKFTRVR